MRLCLLTLATVLSACGGQDPPAPRTPSAPAAPAPLSPSETAHLDTSVAPSGDSVWVGDPPSLVAGPLRELPGDWTVRTTDVAAQREGMATLLTVRTGAHDGFDRVVFTFDGDALPAVHLEYVDRPVRACGSGEPVRLEGEGWLAVRVEPAQAHTEAGKATVPDRRQAPAFPALREWALTCDFEADVTLVLGLAAPLGYRAAVLHAPLRLVVDVRHGR
ncbi:hypothetical protein [Rubrivirga sp. IMCC45206]|uniref:AMIN-like domain-containing (lipo)protein n=1 Tax=Rubrivirga sp. IMCC45206 TaxID=3391614 RepID=UPI00398FD410